MKTQARNLFSKSGPWRWLLLLTLAAVTCGCSVKKIAINKLGDSLANGGTTFASDDDPDLVGQALPFSLKLLESLLAESPKHRGLLFAAASGFTQYAYVFVQQPEEQLEDRNPRPPPLCPRPQLRPARPGDEIPGP